MFDINNPNIPLINDEGLEQIMLIYKSLYDKGKHYLPAAAYIANIVKLSTDHNPIRSNIEEFYVLRKYCCIQEICSLINAMKEDIEIYGLEEFIGKKKKQSDSPDFLSCLNVTDISDAIQYPKEMIKENIEKDEISKLPKLIKFLYEENSIIDERHAGISTLPYIIHKEVFDSEHNNQGRKRFRVYINNPLGKSGVEFYLIFIKKLIEQRIPYSVKFNYNKLEDRKDKSIFYFPIEYLNAVTKILDDIYIEYPELISNFGTPPTACAQTSYYGISHTGASIHQKMRTYNMFVNDVTSCAYFIYFCKQLLIHGSVFFTLTEKEKTVVRKYAQGVLNESVFNEIINSGSVFQEPLISQIISKYSSQFKIAIQTKDYGNILKRVVSVRMYGDLNHIDHPMCFNESFYDVPPISSKKL